MLDMLQYAGSDIFEYHSAINAPKPPPPPTFHQFTNLATELQDLVLEYCSMEDILNLAATSSLMHSLASTRIYQNVDISIRPNTHDFATLYMSRRKLKNSNIPQFNPFNINSIERKLLSRQESFQSALASHPEQGSLVKSFTWTYYLPKSDIRGRVYGSTWEQLLDTMSNLHTINLYALTQSDTPIPLQSATSIRLSGYISQLFNGATVHVSKITTLELDNIIERPDHLQRRGPGLDMPPRYPTSLKAPGKELDYKTLTDRCSSLKNLAIRSYGQGIDASDRWDASADELRYAQWSAFIASTSSTLETLEIELFDITAAGTRNQRHRFAYRTRWSRFEQQQQQINGNNNLQGRLSNRPMDRRFVEIMVPVLARQLWPRLRKVSILGLVQHDGVLAEAFGPLVELVFRS